MLEAELASMSRIVFIVNDDKNIVLAVLPESYQPRDSSNHVQLLVDNSEEQSIISSNIITTNYRPALPEEYNDIMFIIEERYGQEFYVESFKYLIREIKRRTY